MIKSKKIEYKKFKIYRLIIVIILTAIMSTFVAIGNFIIPLIIFAIAFVVMFLLNKKTKELLTDERIDKIAGRASRITMSIFVIIMAVAGITLVALRNVYPQYALLGNVLLFSECGMMLLYFILFKYYSKKKA